MMSPVSSAPLPFAPAGQCKTVPPSKCPPQLISIRPSQSESIVSSQNWMRGLLRITHWRSLACRKDLRVEVLGPFHHRRVKMGMGNCNGANAAARLDCPYGLLVEKEMQSQSQISFGRPQKQSALANCKFRLGPDPHKVRRLIFQAVLMTSGHSL